ncbi:MAG: hypothetical protein ACJ8GN_12165 [Longimicrobiaceae bacterium]
MTARAGIGGTDRASTQQQYTSLKQVTHDAHRLGVTLTQPTVTWQPKVASFAPTVPRAEAVPDVGYDSTWRSSSLSFFIIMPSRKWFRG